MACRSTQMWSLSGLMAAFLDLAIAYLLLCSSAVFYFASKFLGFFGLHLPCLCDGTLFSIGSESFCLSRLLYVFPGETVSHVVRSVVEKFPFNNLDLKIRNRGALADVCVNEIVELEGEASCSSVGDVVRVREISGRAEKYDLKGKGVFNYRPRSRLRQRRKGYGGLGKNAAIGAGDPSLCEAALGVEPCLFGSSANKEDNGLAGDISTMGVNEAKVYFLEYHDKVPTTGVTKREVGRLERNPSHGEDMLMTDNTLCIEELQNDQKVVQKFGEDEENTIRMLERKLEEERSACAALYSDLEKERSAAASAADEAMAMILRLQEEKASIEMEARQYQRILEEKSVYDAEEMMILQEILIRREKEKHFLEKEVEAYRQMASEGNEQLESGRFDRNDDQILISQESTGSIEKNMTVEKNFSSFVSVDKPTSKLASVIESPIQSHIERSFFLKQGKSDEQSMRSVCKSVGNMDLQEKEIISVNNSVRVLSELPKEFIKDAPLEEEELEPIQELNSSLQPDEKTIIPCTGTKMDDPGFSPSSEKDTSVHDVHIDGINFFSEVNADKSKPLLFSNSMKVDVKNSGPFEAATTNRFHAITNCPSSSASETAFDGKRRNSEVSRGFPLVGSRGLPIPVATVDLELLKIGSEVGWLRERLKLVQEGREKLSFSGENRDRVDTQLKLLEDIARQVQEIRHLTETGKAARQGSLPLPTSKVVSKKRRSRSVSSSVQMSSAGKPYQSGGTLAVHCQ